MPSSSVHLPLRRRYGPRPGGRLASPSVVLDTILPAALFLEPPPEASAVGQQAGSWTGRPEAGTTGILHGTANPVSGAGF